MIFAGCESCGYVLLICRNIIILSLVISTLYTHEVGGMFGDMGSSDSLYLILCEGMTVSLASTRKIIKNVTRHTVL